MSKTSVNSESIVNELSNYLSNLFVGECYTDIDYTNSVYELCILNTLSIRICISDNMIVVKDIVLSENVRGRGSGTSIIRFIEQLAFVNGIDSIELESIFSDNMFKIAKKLNYTRKELGDYFTDSSFLGSYTKKLYKEMT